jgi:NADH-quinone oxidoreductase subunit N
VTPVALFLLTVAPALAAVLAALAADAFASPDRSSGAAAAAALLAAAGLVSFVGGWLVSPAVVLDAFSVGAGRSTVAGLVLLLAACVLFGSVGTGFGRGGSGAALVSLGALGSALAVLSSDLVIMLLALETAAVSAYALVASARTRRSAEAAFKYFVQAAVATGLLVFGTVVLISIAAGASGHATLSAVLSSVRGGPSVLAAVLLVVVALAFKLAAAPFHSWAPDAYEAAPPHAAAFLAGPAKLAAGTTLAAFLVSVVPQGVSLFRPDSVIGDVVVILAVLAILSMVVGSLQALAQPGYLRMLGYAGVAQAGYALVAMAALNPTAAGVHLSLYAVGSTGVLLASAAFLRIDPHWDGSVAGLAGLGRRAPLLGVAVTVCMASLAGIPPFGGFWGKFQAFGAALSAAGATWGRSPGWAGPIYVALVVFGVVGSVVSVGYYGKVFRALHFDPVPEDVQAAPNSPGSPSPDARWAGAPATLVVVLALVLLIAGVLPLASGFAVLMKGFLLG